MKNEPPVLEHESEAPAPGASDAKYDAKAKKDFKAISARVGALIGRK